jgi:Cu-processing system permease protein
MLARILTIAMNTYREAVRGRVLHALLALAFATTGYSLVVGTLSLNQEARVVADIGAASTSLYAVLVAIVLGATSLHREIEYKTIFPILARPLHRFEYLLGKYVGTVVTLAVFVALDGGLVMTLLGFESGREPKAAALLLTACLAILAALLWASKRTRVFVLIPWSVLFATLGTWLAEPAGAERQLVLASAALTICEVSIIVAVATLFASFSSPALTAVFTLGVFLVGRSADTLSNLPVRLFGQTVRTVGQAMAHVFPNLQVYVPPRPLLLGEVPDVSLPAFVVQGAVHAALYATLLLVVAALAFQRRDFQ